MMESDPTGPGRRTLYFSAEAGGDMGRKIGTAHYSYGIVARRFAGMAQRRDNRVIFLDMPEKFKRRQDLERISGGVPDRPIHIAFRSTENMRILAGAFNICHFAWEFDALSDRNLVSEPVTGNQRHMLGLMDEIWVPSAFTAGVLAAHGFPNAHVVPTPVCGGALPERLSRPAALELIGPLAAMPYFMSWGAAEHHNAALAKRTLQALADHPAMQKAIADNGKIVLSVCNPGDRRKNLLNLVDGFLMASGPADVLIVKLAIPAEKPLFDDSPFQHLRPRYNGPAATYHPRVLLVSDYLGEAAMGALYSLADCFLSPSHAEGHNLPLLEAMAHGTLAVATANTAMTDYLSADNAVIVAERRYHGVVAEMAAEISGQSPVLAFADRFDIARALREAFALAPQRRAAMTERARAMVAARYREAVIADIFEVRLRAVEARMGEPVHAA